MKHSGKITVSADGVVLSSRPPKAVNVRSAEGYVGRLPGLESRKAPKLTVSDLSDAVRELTTQKK
jgi:hypothetical protein